MEISLMKTFKRSMRFCLKTYPIESCTSKNISSLFGMDVMDYNRKLLAEVIQHKECFIGAAIHDNHFSCDLTFRLSRVREEVYINRFKEVFAPQLMLVVMEGGVNE